MSAPVRQLPSPPELARPPWPHLPATSIAAAIALVLIAGVAGWAGRGATSPEAPPPPEPARSVDLGAVQVSVPGSWALERGPIGGLGDLGPRTAAFAPAPGLSARAVVTLGAFQDRTLVPEPLRDIAGSAAPRRTKLAGLPAWIYRPQERPGNRIAQVTVAPTTAGSLAIVCIAPVAVWSGAAGCADGIDRLALSGASALVPSPTLAFRRRLAPVLERLGTRRAELRTRLRGATTRRGQARFATRLSRAHARAAVGLSPRAPAGAPQRVVRALRGSARGYRRLSVAARNGWPRRYGMARRAVGRSDRALARALARLR